MTLAVCFFFFLLLRPCRQTHITPLTLWPGSTALPSSPDSAGVSVDTSLHTFPLRPAALGGSSAVQVHCTLMSISSRVALYFHSV